MDFVEATFLERKNRFVALCDIKGKKIEAYLPNPGRRWELLLPNTRLLLKPIPSRMKYRISFVEKDGELVCLDSVKISQIVPQLFVDWFGQRYGPSIRLIKTEFSLGHHRYDGLLDINGTRLLLEVKSCTLFYKDLAMFPDAPTGRGLSHIESMTKTSGGILVFAIQSTNIEYFLPDFHTDPAFSEALYEAKENLSVFATTMNWQDPKKPFLEKCCRIPWDIYEREAKDRGAYLLLLHLGEETPIDIPGVKERTLRRGHYVYVGSAMRGLGARIQRHLRKRKKLHWHIDRITPSSDYRRAIPIVSSDRIECHLARSIGKLADGAIKNFGSSDCSCSSHLFYFQKDPLSDRRFINIILDYRMGRLVRLINQAA